MRLLCANCAICAVDLTTILPDFFSRGQTPRRSHLFVGAVGFQVARSCATLRRPAAKSAAALRGSTAEIPQLTSSEAAPRSVPQLYADHFEAIGDNAAAALMLANTMRAYQPTAPKPLDQSRTVPEVARFLRVNPGKVLAWIRRGWLRGFNLAEHEAGRPKYRVNPQDLEAFTNLRVPIQAPPIGRPVGRRRIPQAKWRPT